jgi:RecB family endonuclease NucS
LVIARCAVDYQGRLQAHLPMALRLLVLKADGSVLVHSDGGSYKPLNWMSPPCRIREEPGVWRVVNRSGEELRITIEEIIHDTQHNLGLDPGLQKDGVEAHLQELLAADPTLLGDGLTLVRREYPTAIGPVDLLCRPSAGTAAVAGEVDGAAEEAADTTGPKHWAVEVKRRASIDAVEQLTRYLDLLNRNPLLTPVGGILAAQSIAPQARTLAEIRGFRCVVIDYDDLRGKPRDDMTLF